METKNLLNKKITQWLLLVAMLVGCSASVWAADCGSTNVDANTTIYVDASYVSGDFSNVYLSLVGSANKEEAGYIKNGDVSGMNNYGPKSGDIWNYKTYTAKNGNIYTFKITSAKTIYGIAVWSKDLSGYDQIWQTNVSATCDFKAGGTYTIKPGSTYNETRQSNGYTGTWESWSPCDDYTVPSKVLDGSKVMCYITSYNWDNGMDKAGICSSTSTIVSDKPAIQIPNKADAYVYIDVDKVPAELHVTNNGGNWNGEKIAENQTSETVQGSYYKGGGSTSMTAATKLSTFTVSSTEITEGTASVTLTLKNDKTTSSYDNRPIKNLIYVDDVMVDCADGSTSDINKTLNTSSWEIGNHEIKIILTDGTIYHIGGTQTITVTSACTPPTAGSISGTTNICAGNGTTLTLSGQTAGTNLQWYKSTDGSSYSVVSGATGTELSTGALSANAYYKVRVSRADDASCYSETEVTTVTANPLPTANISGNDAVCQNGSLQLNGSGGTSYSWNGGEYGTTDTYNVPTTSTGQQNITLKVKNVNNCESAEASKTVTIKANPSISSIAAGTGDNECGTGNVTFNSTGATSGATIQWYEGSSKLKEGSETSYTLEIAGGSSKTLKAKSVKEGCESSFTAEVTGSRKPAPIISATPNNTTAYEVITLESTSGSVLWSKDAADTKAYFVKDQKAVDGDTVEGVSVNFKAPAKGSTYTITAKNKNNDCESNLSITIGTAEEDCGN